MKRREDWKTLKGLKKNGFDITSLLGSPLLVLNSTDEMYKSIDKFNADEGFDHDIKFKKLFKYLCTNEMLNSVGDRFISKIINEDDVEITCDVRFNKKENQFSITLLSIDEAIITNQDLMINCFVSESGVGYTHDVMMRLGGAKDELLKHVAKNAGFTVGYLIPLFYIIAHSDVHPISMQNQPTKKIKPHVAKQKPWLREDLVSIVFLNQLPREQPESKGGHHASPRYHHRRGTWVNLRNERYKNHPKYGDKIYRKASWVGEREAIVNGTTYKVL